MRLLLALLVVAAGMVGVLQTSVQAAETGGYPYADRPTCAVNQCTPDPWRFFYRECTSFVAWKLNANGIRFSNDFDGNGSLDFGNASNWRAAAQQFGLRVDAQPAVGAVAWWSFGHVAWVKAVSGGSVTIEEYNANYDGNYGVRTVASSSVGAFIHFGAVAPPPGIPAYTRDNPPPDGAFLYEEGSRDQFQIRFGLAFPIASYDELVALGGWNKGVMVRRGSIAPLRAVATVPQNTLVQVPGDPAVYYATAGSVWQVGNMLALDCLKHTRRASLVLVPRSLVAGLRGSGRVSMGAVSCTFPQDTGVYSPGASAWWRITGSNPYTRQHYSNSLAVHCWLGAAPRGLALSSEAVMQAAVGDSVGCRDNVYMRNRHNGATYQFTAGQLHYISSPAILACLTWGNVGMVMDVEAYVIDGATLGAPAQCSLEGRMLQAPDGRVVWLQGGTRRWVTNPAILNCVRVRGGADNPVPVSWEVFNRYTEGPKAFCPYPASFRFVRPDGQPAVWRVYADGTRQQATGYCDAADPAQANDLRYRVYVVPPGEVDAHVIRNPTVFGVSLASCRALP